MSYTEIEQEDLTYTAETGYDPDAPLESEKVDTPPNDDGKDTEKEEQAPNDKKQEEQQAQEEAANQLPKSVPYQRFQQKVHEANEMAQKYRELELALAKLQGANDAISNSTSKEKSPPPEEKVDIKQLRKEYHAALLEGDDETALSAQEKIDNYLEKQAELKAQEIAKKIIEEKEAERAKQSAAQESVTRQTVVDNFLKEHDYLDDQAANFNEEAFELFSALFKSSQSSGIGFEDSLKYAVEKSTKLLGLNKSPEKDDKENDKKKTTLTREQIEEQLERAKKAPPKSSDKGTSTGGLAIDPAEMSEEEFAKFRDGGGKFDFES